MNTDYVIVKAIFKTSHDAKKMAKSLIDKGLIATAQLSPILSIYKWEGEKRTEDEVELSCITRSDLYGIVKGFINDNYLNECCQIVSTPVLDMSKDLLKWINLQTSKYEVII